MKKINFFSPRGIARSVDDRRYPRRDLRQECYDLDISQTLCDNFSERKLLNFKNKLRKYDYTQKLRRNKVLSCYYNPKKRKLDIRKLKLRRYLEKVNSGIKSQSVHQKRTSIVPKDKRSTSTFINRKKIEYQKTDNKFSFLG